jgi:hypothetical protein
VVTGEGIFGVYRRRQIAHNVPGGQSDFVTVRIVVGPENSTGNSRGSLPSSMPLDFESIKTRTDQTQGTGILRVFFRSEGVLKLKRHVAVFRIAYRSLSDLVYAKGMGKQGFDGNSN